ncbi:MAG: B12-binding domain-containing radical SAM protein, partial [Candidatus Hodarchaeota archaeon]
YELCSVLEKNEDVENIEGIYYWKNGQLVNNPRNSTIRNLDSIPFPDYDNFSSIMTNNGYLKEYPILTSRGCPYKCTYCSMPKIMGGKWRSHTSQRVIDELQHAKKKYHSSRFTVVDDNFTLNIERVEDICDRLISMEINLPWNSQNGIRADRISVDLAKKMNQSGCHYVWIGIENAEEEVFKTINKGEKLEDIKTGIKHLRNVGIRVGGFFIIGLPYSTKEADLKSVSFVKDLGIDGWWFNFVPYPHTEAWDWVQTNAKMLRPINGALQFGTSSIEPVFETEEYLKEDRINTYNEIHIKLKYFDRLTDPSLKSWDKWQKVLKIVAPYGAGAILSLLIFILKHHVKMALKKIKN